MQLLKLNIKKHDYGNYLDFIKEITERRSASPEMSIK